MKIINIASINRHGGSLLVRLLDGHPDIAAYPVEKHFLRDEKTFPFADKLTGSPTYVPDIEDFKKFGNLQKFFEVPSQKPQIIHRWGKEKADSIGIRKNYLEKAFYQNVQTDFNYKRFISLLNVSDQKFDNINDVYDNFHKAYFKSWDDGKHMGSGEFVAFNGSGGLFLKNFDKYFSEFKGSFALIPIRNIETYISSEKTRLARLFFGTRRFNKPNLPYYLIKNFSYYDLRSIIRTWKVSVTRAFILSENLKNDNFLIYRYETLVTKTEQVMRDLCNKTGIKYNNILLKPTLGGIRWLGNSHYGPQNGINLSNHVSKVLRRDELDIINEETGNLMNSIDKIDDSFLNIKSIDKKLLFDYDLQKSYSRDIDKWTLYSALSFRGFRSARIKKNSFLNVIAFLFSIYSYIFNIPRLLKLNFFPNKGKQNYT